MFPRCPVRAGQFPVSVPFFVIIPVQVAWVRPVSVLFWRPPGPCDPSRGARNRHEEGLCGPELRDTPTRRTARPVPVPSSSRNQAFLQVAGPIDFPSLSPLRPDPIQSERGASASTQNGRLRRYCTPVAQGRIPWQTGGQLAPGKAKTARTRLGQELGYMRFHSTESFN